MPDFEGASAYDDGIPLLSPRRAKGLEFDHVVVVEPALIAEGETGLRELYVALTRPTRTLVVVHARPLPEELDVRARDSPGDTSATLRSCVNADGP